MIQGSKRVEIPERPSNAKRLKWGSIGASIGAVVALIAENAHIIDALIRIVF